jgi:hypothetical protein
MTPQILAAPVLDWRTDLDPVDDTVEVTVGLTYSCSTRGIADGSEAFLAAFWRAYTRYLHEDIDRQLHCGVDKDDLRDRLAELLDPVRQAVERALSSRFRAMVDDLGLAHEKLTQAVTR